MRTQEQIEKALKSMESSYTGFISTIAAGGFQNISDQQLRDITIAKLNKIETLKWILGSEASEAALEIFEPFGENARRMLEIGILQDELVKLGFKADSRGKNYYNGINSYSRSGIDNSYSVYFTEVAAIFFHVDRFVFPYASPTWRQDVLIKVNKIIKFDISDA